MATRGGGEWPKSSQLVLVAAFEDDRLVGIAPLFHAKNILGKPALMFSGAIEVSDFLDFIATPEYLPAFIVGLLDFLITDESIPDWECIDLYNLLEESPTLDLLKTEAEKRGWNHQQIHLQPAPYIPLPDNYQAYLEGLDKKQRHEIRRKLRNITQSPHAKELTFLKDPQALQAETQALIELMAQDPNKREFLSPAMQEHLHQQNRPSARVGYN